jgi:hypothetical protein
LPRPAAGAEVADQGADRVVGIAELLGDVAQGSVLDEGGAEGLILAVEGLGGFEEEAEVVGVIHARGSEMRVDCGRIPGLMVGLGRAASKGSGRAGGAAAG